MPASTSPEPVPDLDSALAPWSRDRSIPPELASGSSDSFRVEAGRARPKRPRGPTTTAVTVYGFAQQAVSLREEPSPRSGIKQKTFCVMAKAHNGERHSRSKLKKDS
jgi:hypothetical protein